MQMETYVSAGYDLSILGDSIMSLESQGYQRIGPVVKRLHGDTEYPYGEYEFLQVMVRSKEALIVVEHVPVARSVK